MTLPLYLKHNDAPSSLSPNAHTGLWFDKFCNRWSDRWELDSPAKLEWIQTVTGRTVGDRDLLQEHSKRLFSLARGSGGEARFFKTASRFVTGLGREHPIENGFAWHSTLGVPYLPGSSVKGLVRAWAKTWAGAAEDEVTHVFGPRDVPASRAQIGGVVFFDAIPSRPVQLKADVMTPHYGPYYERGEAPGDWHSPVPIPFLTVAVDQSFLFALAPRTSAKADRIHCQTAVKWLEEALIELGAGAKSAVGYGRFARDRAAETDAKKAEGRDIQAALEAQKKAAFTASLSGLSSLACELAQAAHDQKWEIDGNAFKAANVAESWLARLEAAPRPDAIARLRHFFDRHFSGLLANPEKTEGKKNTPAFKPRWVALAKRLNALINHE